MPAPKPDLSKLDALLKEWHYEGATSKYDSLGEDIEAELKHLGLLNKLNGLSKTLYRLLNVKEKHLQSIIENDGDAAKVKARKYSSWTNKNGIDNLTLFLHSGFGIILEARISSKSSVLDFMEYAHFAHDQGFDSALRIQDLREELEVIIKDAPTECDLYGVAVSDDNLLNKVYDVAEEMGIKVIDTDGGCIIKLADFKAMSDIFI